MSDLEHDLLMAAELLAARGVWNQPDAFGDDTDYGPIDPIAAVWLAIHGRLPLVFTAGTPGAAAIATQMVLQDDHVLTVLEFLAANIDSELPTEATVERIADWTSRAPAGEVIGRIARLGSRDFADSPRLSVEQVVAAV